jgi:NurA domain
MPLKPAQLWQLLQAKQTDFTTFDQTSLEVLRLYRQALKAASGQTNQQLETALTGLTWVGAKPLETLAKATNWQLPSHCNWANRQDSLAWVRDRITGITTFAVDGSQIYPSKDLSIPIALVQVGWFENPHLPDGTYTKDVRLDVMTPADLADTVNGRPTDRLVNMHRFQMETERLIEYMQQQPEPAQCLVFFDGALVATFAEAFDAKTRAFYIDCLLNLLRTSNKYRIPLVGYIDTSNARDLVVLLRQLYQLEDAPGLRDARLLAEGMNWGDRTPIFCCDRDVLAEYQEQSQSLAFTYLKAHDGLPVRLEFPRWIYEDGLHEQVIDWVKAEVIVGGGYPYAIETADQTAVLQTSDRQMFYQILQDWAEQTELRLRFSRKMVSKVRRR